MPDMPATRSWPERVFQEIPPQNGGSPTAFAWTMHTIKTSGIRMSRDSATKPLVDGVPFFLVRTDIPPDARHAARPR